MPDIEDIIPHIFTDHVIKLSRGNPGLMIVGIPDDWNSRFLSSVMMGTQQNKPLSTAQAQSVLRIARSHREALDQKFGAQVVSALLDRPTYRNPPYQTRNFPREVRHLGGNLLGFRFKLDERLVGFLRNGVTNAMSASATKPRFDAASRLWVVPVTRQNLSLVMTIIAEFDFGYDDATLEWLTLAHNSVEMRSTAFAHPEAEAIVVNVCSNEIVSAFVQHVLDGEPA